MIVGQRIHIAIAELARPIAFLDNHSSGTDPIIYAAAYLQMSSIIEDRDNVTIDYLTVACILLTYANDWLGFSFGRFHICKR